MRTKYYLYSYISGNDRVMRGLAMQAPNEPFVDFMKRLEKSNDELLSVTEVDKETYEFFETRC